MILATEAFNIIMTITAILLTIGLGYLLYRLARHNARVYREETSVLVESFIPKNQMKAQVEAHLTRIGVYSSCSMYSVSIDDYEGLKESIGKDESEQVLKELATRIARLFNKGSILTRNAHADFLILDKTEVDQDNLLEQADDLMATIREPFLISHGEEISITASVGIALYPTCGQSYNDLVKSLEVAAYVARRDGGDRYQVYQAEIDEAESSNLEYFKEVRNAMDKNQFCFYYQPIVDIKEKRLFGFEAFLRWNHPIHGVIAPQKFIHILERSGDIHYVSKWGLEQIIIIQKHMQENLGENDICITYNLSGKQLMSDSIADDFRKLIHKLKGNPSKIILEVGEYAMFEKMDVIKSNLLRLKDTGFRVSVDGLGLDYNTITRLENEPIDMIKLDKSFLENIDENFIKEKFVHMLVDSASRLNRYVVAEGIEEFKVVDYLLQNEINLAQGYYFSRPFESEKLVPYVVKKSFERLLTENENHELSSSDFEI